VGRRYDEAEFTDPDGGARSITHDPAWSPITSALMAAKKSPDEFAGGPWTVPATVRLVSRGFRGALKRDHWRAQSMT
jgi:hypothetical protein